MRLFIYFWASVAIGGLLWVAIATVSAHPAVAVEITGFVMLALGIYLHAAKPADDR